MAVLAENLFLAWLYLALVGGIIISAGSLAVLLVARKIEGGR